MIHKMIAEEMRYAERETRRVADDDSDRNRVLPAWIQPTPEVAAEQSRLWNKQSDFKVLGAILSECEKAMRQINEGTFRNRMSGEHETFCAEAADDAKRFAAVVASLRSYAFNMAQMFDQKAKALRRKA